MKHLKVIIMLPLAIIGLLLLIVIDLVRMAQGKQTVDEAEWNKLGINDSNADFVRVDEELN